MVEITKRADPFLAFRFELRLDGIAAGGFSEISGLGLETEIQDYPEGGINTHLLKFPTRTKQTNLVLKRGLVDQELWDWYFAVVQGRFKRHDGSVVVRDPAGQKDVLVWNFRAAFPCKWSGPELNAGQSAVAVETVELCHEGLELTSSA